jgi:hypothetical protein
MMIVKERPISAVVAAVAWITMLHVWQFASSESQRNEVDAPEPAHIATASALPRTVAGNYTGHH